MRTRALVEAEILDPDDPAHVDYTDGTYEDWDGKYIPLEAYVRVVDQPFGNSCLDWTDEIAPALITAGATAIHVLAEYREGESAMKAINQPKFDFTENDVRITCKPGTCGAVAAAMLATVVPYGIGETPDDDFDEEQEPGEIETWDDALRYDASDVSMWYTDEGGTTLPSSGFHDLITNPDPRAVYVHFWHD